MLWERKGEVGVFSPCNMVDGVLPRNMRIEHMVNTEDPTDVDMEREDLGQMTSTFLRVSLLKK